MKRTYQRSPILSFIELGNEQQLNAIDNLGAQIALDTSYVLYDNEALPLCSFMRVKIGLFNLVLSVSSFSGFLIKINKTGDAATVVYANW